MNGSHVTMAMHQYPQDIPSDLVCCSSGQASSGRSRKNRKPQYSRTNESSAQRGQALRLRVNNYVESISGSALADTEDNDLVIVSHPSSSSSSSSASSSSASSTGAAASAATFQELTDTNIQLLNSVQDTTAVAERIWRRGCTLPDDHEGYAAAAADPHVSLRVAGSPGDSRIELLETGETWGTAATTGSYRSDTYAAGAWAR